MLAKKIEEFLKHREFISAATCDLSGRPNAAPKFFLKLEHSHIYLIDYTLSKTWENLKINPHISLSFVDTEELVGYQVNGTVTIVEKGAEFQTILHELRQKAVSLSAKRIIEGVSTGKKHKSFEINIPDKFAIYKVKIAEVTEIGLKGDLKKENIS